MNSLSEPVWRSRREVELARVRPLALDRVLRSGRKHPVYDFLFEYYSHRPAHLLRWSPGVAVVLEGATLTDIDWPNFFRVCPGGIVLPAELFPERRRPYLKWAIEYLHAVSRREPVFGCFGMHEWAMVYRTDDIRHSRVPLRFSQAETDAVVESMPVRCSHYDAYRFFTSAAVPLNRDVLSRETTIQHDQPGCLHVNMDLYKFAYKLAPFVSSEVMVSAFELAVAARELDMRASPYDLSEFGFPSIRIETKAGREEYVEGQQAVWRRGVPVRERLLAEYQRVAELV
jgi:hypothetical protein